jgi:hypothetical protein
VDVSVSVGVGGGECECGYKHYSATPTTEIKR